MHGIDGILEDDGMHGDDGMLGVDGGAETNGVEDETTGKNVPNVVAAFEWTECETSGRNGFSVKLP